MKLNIHRSPIAWAALVLTGASALAQPVAPPPPGASAAGAAQDVRPPIDPRGPRARPPGVRPPAMRPGNDALVAATVSGRVVRWLPNPNGDVDGLLLDDGTQVTFAPMISGRLIDAVKLQDNVQILGRHGSNPKVIHATQIKNTKSGQTFAADPADGDAPPAQPPVPPTRDALTPMTASGRIATVLYTDRGDANGVLLDNGQAVRFPPHVGEQLSTDLKVGGTLYARGYGTRSAQGASFEATRMGTSESNARDVFPARPPTDDAAAPGLPPPPPADGAPPRPPADRAAGVAPPASSAR